MCKKLAPTGVKCFARKGTEKFLKKIKKISKKLLQNAKNYAIIIKR